MKKIFFFAAFLITANFSRAQWEPDVRLTNDPAGSNTSINNQRCVASLGDTVHVVWYDLRDGNDEIYYKRSTDRGSTWGNDTRLTNNSGDSYHPAVSAGGSIVHVAWSDNRDGNYEIYYKRSTDRGTTWEPEIRLTNADSTSYNPSIAIVGLIVNIVWYDIRDGNWEIYYKRSTDGGLTWESDKRLTNDHANSFNPSVAVSGSLVHVVWGDYRTGPNGEIFYKQSLDNGVTWGQDIQLTNNAGVSRRPCVAASDSVVHLVWYDYRDADNEIYYKQSADNGMTWSADVRLTNSAGASFDPSIAVAGSAVHIVWYDTRDSDLEIYYKRSEDKGLTWGTDTRLTNSSGASQYPSIAISDAVVHVVWADTRDGNAEIYYKRDTTGGYAVGTDNRLTGMTVGQSIKISPNPASCIVHIYADNNSNQTLLQTNETTFLVIRNILGVVLINQQIQNGETAIDASGLLNGLYFACLKTGNKQTVSTKLVILK